MFRVISIPVNQPTASIRDELIAVVVCFALGCCNRAAAQQPANSNSQPEGAAGGANVQTELPARGVSPLISESFPSQSWVFFSAKTDARLEQTWHVQMDPQSTQPMLVCTGSPQGYLRTKEEFSNFDLGMEWRYPDDDDGNSGVFLFTAGDDRIWPTGLQVQLHQPTAGSAFPSGGAKSDNELRNVPLLSTPVNQWNRCIISSVNGRVTVTINDTKVGEVAGCSPSAGSIALQSEGSEVHFRRLWIRRTGEPAARLMQPPVSPRQVWKAGSSRARAENELVAPRSRKRNPRLLGAAWDSW